MAKKAPRPQPKQIRPDDIDPHHRWDRPLQAPGRTQVDFEERVNFRRLHDYRLARVRAALARLVAYGVQLRAGTITPQGIAAAVDVASSQGWRRPLLAWLGVQLKRAQDAGDSETAARLKRRIELVSG